MTIARQRSARLCSFSVCPDRPSGRGKLWGAAYSQELARILMAAFISLRTVPRPSGRPLGLHVAAQLSLGAAEVSPLTDLQSSVLQHDPLRRSSLQEPVAAGSRRCCRG